MVWFSFYPFFFFNCFLCIIFYIVSIPCCVAQYFQKSQFRHFFTYCIHILHSLHLDDRQSIASDLNLGPLHVNPRCSLVRIFTMNNNQINFFLLINIVHCLFILCLFNLFHLIITCHTII